jgi:hypothetical protein
MCRSEWQDLHERKYKPSEAELRQIENSDKIHKALRGQLSPTTEEWIKARRKEQ